MSRPQINVTPLIDILLVLLIIFMVISPLKPSAFKARVPSERRDTANVKTNPETIVLTIRGDSAVIINSEPQTASIDDPTPVTKRLRDIFDKRIVNGSIDPTASSDPNRPFADVAQRTVFIKAPKTLAYGSVAKVVDAAKLGGAYPISLQIDDLSN